MNDNQGEAQCPACGHPNHQSKMHQNGCTFYVSAMGAECGCSYSQEFDPETLHGISFYDSATSSPMRYIYPDASQCAGWIVRKTRGGKWETPRVRS